MNINIKIDNTNDVTKIFFMLFSILKSAFFDFIVVYSSILQLESFIKFRESETCSFVILQLLVVKKGKKLNFNTTELVSGVKDILFSDTFKFFTFPVMT